MKAKHTLFTLAVYGVVVRATDQKILVLRFPGGKENAWMLPGGKVESSDTFAQTLKREVQEETNLIVEVGAIVHADRWVSLRSGEKAALYYHCTLEGGEVTLSDEHEEYRWFTIDELRELGWYRESAMTACFLALGE